MSAAVVGASGGLLIYFLAAALCVVYTTDTVIVAYNYRFFASNPPSSKLLFLAEALKLLTASSFYFWECRRARDYKALGTDDTDGYKPRCGSWWLPSHLKCHQQQFGRTWWLAVAAWAKAMLVFAVPAVCYFITNNLSFYALRIMSAHTYTLLSDLKVITTCVLSYLLLDKALNRQAVSSLFLLFTGICIGQYATSTADETASALPVDASWWHGVALMALVAVLSAVAAVYTEWVMNYSATYGQESLNLQNMRLYASGTLLNGLFCILHTKTSISTFDDMRASHWVCVVGLAFMGLVTALIIKRFGNIVKVYASCVASLFSAGISYTILHDPPVLLFYCGCICAMLATLQLQRARAAMASGKTSQDPQSRVGKVLWCVLAVVTVALLFNQATSPKEHTAVAAARDVENSRAVTPPVVPRVRPSFKPLGPVTDAPMLVLPPFEPTCLATDLARMQTWGCPIMQCSQDPSCTVHNTSCCAYLNYQMLSFLDDFLASKCLQDEYLVVFGSAIGALRNKTILPHTEDIDLGMTPLALQFLELNTTKEELWRHGYVVWHQAESGMGWWKMCPHIHHPSPDFQAAIVKEPTRITAKMKLTMPIYADFWPMWPVDDSVQDCRKRTRLNTTAILATPWDAYMHAKPAQAINPCTLQQQANAQAKRRWCIHSATKPFHTKPGTRGAPISNRWFPTPADQDEFLDTVYGPNWRTPDKPQKRNHGAWIKTPDASKMVQAMLEKLSLGAWGGMPYKERVKRCKRRSSFWG